jgi:hypothetical protein
MKRAAMPKVNKKTSPNNVQVPLTPLPAAQLSKIRTLQSLKHCVDEYGFRRELGELVWINQRRYANPSYFEKVKTAITEGAMAADRLSKFVDNLGVLDFPHILALYAVLERLHAKHSRRDWNSILLEMSKCALLVETIVVCVQMATGVSNTPPGRGRPRSPYILAAYELAVLWEEWTETPVATPKPFVKGEAVQESVEFVRLGLRMISDKISGSQARTAISHAVAFRKRDKRRAADSSDPLLDVINTLKEGGSLKDL